MSVSLPVWLALQPDREFRPERRAKKASLKNACHILPQAFFSSIRVLNMAHQSKLCQNFLHQIPLLLFWHPFFSRHILGYAAKLGIFLNQSDLMGVVWRAYTLPLSRTAANLHRFSAWGSTTIQNNVRWLNIHWIHCKHRAFVLKLHQTSFISIAVK